MDTVRTVIGDAPARGDALASALGVLVAFVVLAAIFDGPVSATLLAVGALVLLVLAAGAAYRGGGYLAAVALALLPVLGWLLAPLPAGGEIGRYSLLVGAGAGVGLGTLGFVLGAGARAVARS